ncbi:STAS domain-containing protein [Thioclava sp. BHET1]|nr:STAS domain-containing protein [Thioclava sp. BHET1]
MDLRTEWRAAALPTAAGTEPLLIVRVQEARIDAAVAIRFKDRMREVIAESTGTVLLDLGQVGFLDSSGLGAVVAVKKMLAPDRQLELSALTPGVEKVFRLTRMDRVFTIHPETPAAAGQANAP